MSYNRSQTRYKNKIKSSSLELDMFTTYINEISNRIVFSEKEISEGIGKCVKVLLESEFYNNYIKEKNNGRL